MDFLDPEKIFGDDYINFISFLFSGNMVFVMSGAFLAFAIWLIWKRRQWALGLLMVTISAAFAFLSLIQG